MKVKRFLALLLCSMSLTFGMSASLAFLTIQASPVSADSTTLVRIIHGSPDIGTADIFVDGTKLLSSFPFGQITDYVAVPAGFHKVQVALIGKGPGAAIITQDLNVKVGVTYTVAAVGTKSTGLSLEAFIDDNQVASGKAKVRAYDLSPDASSVNVATNGQMLFNGLTYKQASDYLSLPAGSSTFQVTAPQMPQSASVSATLKVNTVTSIFSVGLFNGTPQLQLVVAQANGVPGFPKTGSDPNAQAQPENSQPLIPWLLGVLVLAAIGTGITSRRLILARKSTTVKE